MKQPELIKTIKEYKSTCPECEAEIIITVTHKEGEPNSASSYTCENCGFIDWILVGQEN